MIETDTVKSTLETLTLPLTLELRQMQTELAAFDQKVQELLTRVQLSEIDNEQEAVRLALSLDQLRSELSCLFNSTGRTPLPQLTMQATARLRHLGTHFRAIAREEQVRAQLRRTEEIIARNVRHSSLSLSR